jgi:uncharacterized membrane protein YjgN (DUF898 family)
LETTNFDNAQAPGLPAIPVEQHQSPAPDMQKLAMEFRGEGSVYFGIWAVNLLLIFVTLGIYYPWAKYRRLKYFHQHTFVDGQPLDFLAKPTQMAKGYFIGIAVFAIYSVTSNFVPMVGLGVLALIALALPWAMRSARRFYLANTSWRGLRFAFLGNTKDIYIALAPAVLLGFALAAVGVFMAETPLPGNDAKLTQGLTILALSVAYLLVLPTWTFYKINQYFHSNYAWSTVHLGFTGRFSDFVKLGLKTVGMSFAVYFLVILAVGISVAMGAASMYKEGENSLSGASMVALGVGGLLGVVLVVVSVIAVKAYFTSRLQNLLWTKSSAPGLHFASSLGWGRLVALGVKNWVLIILTLGFYWPFATVALTRLKIGAMSLTSNLNFALLTAQVGGKGGAAADALTDLFDVDLAL